VREFQIDKKIDIPEHVRSIFITLDCAGFFNDGILVGSWTMLFYQEAFGIEYVLRTNDIDFALLPEVSKIKKGPDLEAAFSDQGFDPITDILSGLQKFLVGTFEVEFLVHRKGDREEIVMVSKYNVNAQPLPFLDLLFIEPIIVYHPDFKVRLPSPEALFLHKLIIAQRRKKESKKAKDLEQCATLAPHLDTNRLINIAKEYRMSRETMRNILASCETIDYQTDFLRYRL